MNNWQRKVRPGDPLRISATAYNKFIDTAIAYERRTFRGPSPGTSFGSYVMAYNVGNTTIDAFTPVRITGLDSASVTRRDPRPILEFGFSSTSTPSSRDAFMVLQEAIRPDTIGPAVVSGATWCKVQKKHNVFLRRGMRLSLGIGQLVPKSNGAAVLLEDGLLIPGQQTMMAPISIGAGSDDFYALILDAEQIENKAQWLYTWVEVEFVDGNWEAVVGGRYSATWAKAINTLESENTASVAYSIPVAGPNFEIGNTGVRFRPVPYPAVVRMHVTYDNNFDPVVTFQAPNPVWGNCTPLSGLVTSGDFGTSNELTSDVPSEETP